MRVRSILTSAPQRYDIAFQTATTAERDNRHLVPRTDLDDLADPLLSIAQRQRHPEAYRDDKRHPCRVAGAPIRRSTDDRPRAQTVM